MATKKVTTAVVENTQELVTIEEIAPKIDKACNRIGYMWLIMIICVAVWASQLIGGCTYNVGKWGLEQIIKSGRIVLPPDDGGVKPSRTFSDVVSENSKK